MVLPPHHPLPFLDSRDDTHHVHARRLHDAAQHAQRHARRRLAPRIHKTGQHTAPFLFFPDTRACEHARIRNPSTSHRRSPNTFRPTGSPRGPSPYTEQQNSLCSTPPTNPDTPRVGEERESHATPDPGRDAKDQTTGVEIFGVTRRARFVSDDRLRVGSLTSRSSEGVHRVPLPQLSESLLIEGHIAGASRRNPC